MSYDHIHLKEWRNRLRLTIQEAADYFYVSDTTYSKYESGRGDLRDLWRSRARAFRVKHRMTDMPALPRLEDMDPPAPPLRMDHILVQRWRVQNNLTVADMARILIVAVERARSFEYTATSLPEWLGAVILRGMPVQTAREMYPHHLDTRVVASDGSIYTPPAEGEPEVVYFEGDDPTT